MRIVRSCGEDASEKVSSDGMPPPGKSSDSFEQVDEGLANQKDLEKEERATAGEEQSAVATDASCVVPANIVVLPFLPVIVPFPGAIKTWAAPSSEAMMEMESEAPSGVLDLSTSLSSSLAEAPGASEGDEAVTPGLTVIEGGLRPLSKREQLAEGLRQAMAQLEELQEKTPTSAKGLLPFPGPTAPDSNIVTIDFGQGAGAPSEGPFAGGPGETQLPTESAGPENPAAEHPPVPGMDEVSRGRLKTLKPALDGAFAMRQGPVPDAVGSAGTSAAREEIRMESRASNEQQSFAGQDPDDSAGDAMPVPTGPKPPEVLLTPRSTPEWPAEMRAEAAGRPGADLSNRNPDVAATVDRMATLITREVAHIRQHGSDSMAVVLRPDENTELFLHVSHRNGQIEASVRCERGDFGHLNALWSQLQDSLAQQKIRLASLQGAASDTQLFRYPGGSQQSTGGGDSSPRQQRPGEEFMDEWPAPASPADNPAHVRSRRGSRHRLTTSRPGWETWA